MDDRILMETLAAIDVEPEVRYRAETVLRFQFGWIDAAEACRRIAVSEAELLVLRDNMLAEMVAAAQRTIDEEHAAGYVAPSPEE